MNDNEFTDAQLADLLRPALHELMERLIVRGEASKVARVAHLLACVVSDFGKAMGLAAPVDTATRPMFTDAGGHTQ
jgi:hypothetical protein